MPRKQKVSQLSAPASVCTAVIPYSIQSVTMCGCMRGIMIYILKYYDIHTPQFLWRRSVEYVSIIKVFV